MNRGLNLPQIQRIMNEFERENATMDMKEEMMSEAVDDVMDDELEDEEEESDKILKQDGTSAFNSCLFERGASTLLSHFYSGAIYTETT